MFLVTSSREIKGFTRESDREFFSVPVEVETLYSNIKTKLTYVRSPLQGGLVYPVNRENLKPHYLLSQKQIASARTIN